MFVDTTVEQKCGHVWTTVYIRLAFIIWQEVHTLVILAYRQSKRVVI